MIENIPFKRIEVKGADALSEWQRLRDQAKGWPVVIGDDEAIVRIAEQISANAALKPADILRTASTMQHPASLLKLRADEDARWKKDAEAIPGNGSDWVQETDAQPLGQWPTVPPEETGLAVVEDTTGKPFHRVHILILPTDKGYEAPAYLNWGGWNECPPPEVHVAALRKWNEVYGAELIGMSGDVIIAKASKRPAAREEAMALAKEHYLYCADIVDQGVENLSNLGAGLMNSDWWYFWWD